MQTRISEQKVNELIFSLDKKLRLEMDLIDTKLSEQLKSSFLEVQTKQKNDVVDLNDKIEFARAETRAVDTKVFESVRVIEFHKLQAKIDQIKNNVEGEMDQL